MTAAGAVLGLVLLSGGAIAADLSITDGDTIRLGVERIRIENIDAPEMHQPGCAAEAVAGFAAAEHLRLILAAGPVEIDRRGIDRYGRTLALLRIGARDVGERMVADGYARPWGGRRESWCSPD